MVDRARPRNPLIIALDTPDERRLGALAMELGPHVGHLKVGLEAFTALGPHAVRAVAAQAPVFLDLKLHDIPTTAAGAAAAAARLGVDLLTVHAAGGPNMLAAAAKAAPDTAILAVTVLTSLVDEDLAAMGQPPAGDLVPTLARLAVEAGAAGVVCAAPDLPRVRAAIGPDPVIVTPGIRPRGSALADQARVATPKAALEAGADHLVIGRPVTGADDPVAAIVAVLEEIRA